MDVSYQAVYHAWQTFRKGKRATPEIDTFAYYLEKNIWQLSQDLLDRTYMHGPYKRVVLQEKKRRDLAVAEVRDRVVHRLVYDTLVSFLIHHLIMTCGLLGKIKDCIKHSIELSSFSSGICTHIFGGLISRNFLIMLITMF